MFAQLAAIILPVLIIAAIGFGWAKSGRVFDNRFVTILVTYIGTPALVADALTRIEVEHAALAEMALLTVACLAGLFALGYAVLRLLRLSLSAYLPAVVFPNTGNMGLPLSLFAFGQEGLAFAVVFFAITATLQFTLGVSLAAGEFDLKRALRMPFLYAVACALLILVMGWRLPLFLANSLHLLGGLTIPLMLLALGASLAELKITRLPRNLLLSALRLAGGFLIAYLVARLFRAEPRAAGVLMIQAAMPVAVFNYLFAQYYDREPADVAAMVMLSTAASFASLPLLLYWLLSGGMT